jgi:hypothetical protein
LCFRPEARTLEIVGNAGKGAASRCACRETIRLAPLLEVLMSSLFRMACLAVIVGLAPARAEDPPAPVSRPGMLVLFDGKSLDGWRKTDFYRPGSLSVEDGMIVMAKSKAMAGMTGISSTRDDLPTMNYELAYEGMRLDGGDFFAAATFPVGKDRLTFVPGGWGGNVTGLSSLDGNDAAQNETSTFVKFENNRWYRFRIQVTPRKIRCWVDDRPIVNAFIENRHLGTRAEMHDCKPLGFAAWETAGALRAITVRPLQPAEIAANEKDADDQQ